MGKCDSNLPEMNLRLGCLPGWFMRFPVMSVPDQTAARPTTIINHRSRNTPDEYLFYTVKL